MDRLNSFISEIIINEGGFQNDAKDKGNYYNGKLYGTVYGITARDNFDAFSVVYNLYKHGFIDSAKSLAINFYSTDKTFLHKYWNPLYNNIIDSSLAFRIFDFGINAGKFRAVKLLQRTINKIPIIKKIKEDGIFGEITLSYINSLSAPDKDNIETEFYYLYVQTLEDYYKSLWNFFKFGSGWIARVKRIFNKIPNLK